MKNTEWLKWRKTGIGGSDAGAIMGVNPHMTILDLYVDKTTDTTDEKENFIQRKGKEIEPRVRALFEVITGREYPVAYHKLEGTPALCSLDGDCPSDNSIIEIKLMGEEMYEVAKRGHVPVVYVPQVQHNLMVSTRGTCYLLGYPYSDKSRVLDSKKLVVVKVLPDYGYQSELLKKEIAFWNNNVLKRKEPPPSERDYKNLRTLAKQVAEYKRLLLEKERIDTRVSELEDMFKEAAAGSGHDRVSIHGLRWQKISRIGNVDYGSIPQLKGVDLDAFRKPGSTYWSKAK